MCIVRCAPLFAVAILWAAVPLAAKTGPFLQDFETGKSGGFALLTDTRLSSTSVAETRNLLDGSRAWALTARFPESNGGFAGMGFDVMDSGNRGADSLEVDVCGGGSARILELALIDREGMRYVAGVKIGDAWKRHSIPLFRFVREAPGATGLGWRVTPETIGRVEIVVHGTVGGEYGFSVDNLKLVDSVPEIGLQCAPESTVPLQRDTTITVTIRLASGEPAAQVSGWLYVAVRDRNSVVIPERVPICSGVAEIPVFLRNPEPEEIHLFEPASGAQAVTRLNVESSGLRVEAGLEEFDGQESVLAAAFVRPSIRLEGDSPLPKAIHIRAQDHRGQVVLSRLAGMADVTSGQAKFLIPSPGLLQVSVRMLAESVADGPEDPEGLPVFVGFDSRSLSTSSPLSLRDGDTTAVVGGWLVVHEDVPVTATVLGEDRFTLWALARSPREARLPRNVFGICIPVLFGTDINTVKTVGSRLIGWQRRLGAAWLRTEVSGKDASAGPGAYSWPRAEAVIAEVKKQFLRLVVSVRAPEDPADAGSLTLWKAWLAKLGEYSAGRVGAVEISDVYETTGGMTVSHAPAIYSSLLDCAKSALPAGQSNPSVISGFEGPFDVASLDHVLSAGPSEVVSFRPPMFCRHLPPEDNLLPEVLREVEKCLRRNDLLKMPIWINSLGWETHPAGVTEFEQANFLVRSYAIGHMERANRLFWADLRDHDGYPWAGPPGAHSGLLDASLRPKPSAVAYNIALFMMNQMTAREISQQGKAVIYSYDIEVQSYKWPGVMHIAWTPCEGDEEEIELPITAGGGVFALDYLGAEQKPRARSHGTKRGERECSPTRNAGIGGSAGIQAFHVTHEPLYIWDVGPEPPRQQKHSHD
jgi:hypothetical protein